MFVGGGYPWDTWNAVAVGRYHPDQHPKRLIMRLILHDSTITAPGSACAGGKLRVAGDLVGCGYPVRSGAVLHCVDVVVHAFDVLAADLATFDLASRAADRRAGPIEGCGQMAQRRRGFRVGFSQLQLMHGKQAASPALPSAATPCNAPALYGA